MTEMTTATNIIEGPFDKIPPVKPGTAIVVMGHKGPLAFEKYRGLSWRARLFGGYRTYFLVDTAKRIVSESYEKVPSKQQTFSFEIAVTWDVEVADPARVVEKGIKDLGQELSTHSRDIVVTHASDYEVEHASQAARKIHDEMMALAAPPRPQIDEAVRVLKVAVAVRADADALDVLKTIENEKRRIAAARADAEVERISREAKKAATATLEDLLAQYLVTDDKRYLDELNKRLDRAAYERNRSIEALKVMVDGKAIEPHDFQEHVKQFLDTLLNPIAHASAATSNLPPPELEVPQLVERQAETNA